MIKTFIIWFWDLLFHKHDWEELDRARMNDITFGEPGIRRTDFLMQCKECKARKVTSKKGHW